MYLFYLCFFFTRSILLKISDGNTDSFGSKEKFASSSYTDKIFLYSKGADVGFLFLNM
jgi:hypothetical protein